MPLVGIVLGFANGETLGPRPESRPTNAAAPAARRSGAAQIDS